MYCHKNCINSYILKHVRALKKVNSQEEFPTVSKKEVVFDNLVSEIDTDLRKGIGYPLSDIRDRCNQLLGTVDQTVFTGKEPKVLLINHYGENVSFSSSHNPSKSSLVFLCNISKEDIVETVRNSDPIRESARAIRDILLKESDPLKDKFCDASDLSDAWDDTKISEPILEFLCILLNADHKHFFEDKTDKESKFSSTKRMKIIALYQILFIMSTMVNKKTPLHLLNAEMIHNTCRSKTLITSFNHYGLCVSYDELVRYHNNMASYILSTSANDIPLPSHFDTNIHTVAAFDNFDHNENTPSGLCTSHDTVSILIQDKPDVIRRKPNISETSVQRGCKAFIGPLPCQKLEEFYTYKSSKKIYLPDSYTPSPQLFSMEDADYITIIQNDIAWIISRLDLSDISNNTVSPFGEQQSMPSWSSFNSVISDRKRKIQQVGFLPILPHPVTKDETVYTSLINFKNVLNQLTQSQIAVFCDEGVYHIAREITLQRPDEFSGIVLCLGSFHMIKAFLACIGKYLSGSGCRTIWTQNKVFGIDVVESVLSGSHYDRSLDGICLLGECISRLQWVEFLRNDVSKYINELKIIEELQRVISEKKKSDSLKFLQHFKVSSSKLLKEFEFFCKSQSGISETFCYWENFLKMVQQLKNLLRADRESNWNLHLHVVKEIMPMFSVCDRTNYLRWGSVYIEDMQKLPETAPDVYKAFSSGNFSLNAPQVNLIR